MILNLDKSTWKRVRLGDVISRSRRQVDAVEVGIDRYVAGGHIDGDSITIDRWGNPNDGQMGSTFRYVFEPGQILFVSARPYLRKSGVVDFSGVVADKTYVLDAVPDNGLLQEFLPFVLASDPFVEYATAEATGSMNPRLLWGPLQRYEFDLPPLDEQKRLADLLWKLSMHEARLAKLSNAARAVAASFVNGTLTGSAAEPAPLQTFLRLDPANERIRADGDYAIAGVLNQGRGLVDKGRSDGASIAYQQLTRLRAGQVVMRKLTAWEGPIQVVPPEFDGFYVSNEFPAFTVDESLVDLGYLQMLFTWPGFWSLMRGRVQGSVERRMRLSPAQLLQVEIPLPLKAVQRQIARDWSASLSVVRLIEAERLAIQSITLGPMNEIFGAN